MMIETPKKIEKGAAKWVVTFGDLMSLLLCFFVLLLSFSEMDRHKYKQVAGSLEKAFGVQRKTRVMEIPKGMNIITLNFDQELIMMNVRQELGEELDEMLSGELDKFKEQIALEDKGEQIVLKLMGESTFDSGSVAIRDQLKPLLSNVAKILEKAPGDIIVAGHTDNVPIRSGPYKTNLRLSIARAAAVAEFMLAHSDISPQRVATMGFGEFRPMETNDTTAGREKNRRVEIILNNLPQPKRE